MRCSLVTRFDRKSLIKHEAMALLIVMGMLAVAAAGQECEQINGKDIPIVFNAQTTEGDSDCSNCIMQYCSTVQLLAAHHAGFASSEWFWHEDYNALAKIGACDDALPTDHRCAFAGQGLIEVKEMTDDTVQARTACCPLMESAGLTPGSYATADLASDACWARMAKPCSWKYLKRVVANGVELPSVPGWFDKFARVVQPRANSYRLPYGRQAEPDTDYRQFCCGRLSYFATEKIHLDSGAIWDEEHMASRCFDFGKDVHPCSLEELHEASSLGHLVTDWTLFKQPRRLFKIEGPSCQGKAEEQCYVNVVETITRSRLSGTDFSLACCGPL